MKITPPHLEDVRASDEDVSLTRVVVYQHQPGMMSRKLDAHGGYQGNTKAITYLSRATLHCSELEVSKNTKCIYIVPSQKEDIYPA